MNFKTIEDFLNEWAYESESTLKMLNNITDESLNQEVYGGGRTLGFIGWHITETISEMMSKTGLKLFAPDMELYNENNAAHLQESYKNASDSLIEKIKENWDDETLAVEDEMYGEKWERGFTLYCLITHQIHHRGQMTVLMRQAGLKVPGVYGPSKEEWLSYGMEPHK